MIATELENRTVLLLTHPFHLSNDHVAMLATVHATLVEQNELKKFTIIRLTESVCNLAQSRR